jgi:hypothetical protein
MPLGFRSLTAGVAARCGTASITLKTLRLDASYESVRRRARDADSCASFAAVS